MSDGVFRKKKGYTTVENTVARNRKLTLKAKGLYLVIQSNITMEEKNWNKKDFMTMVCEGTKAFDAAWNELKETGYLRTHIYTLGHKFRYEYELLDDAAEGPHTFYYSVSGKITRTNLGSYNEETDDNSGPKVQESQETSRLCQKGGIVKGGIVEGDIVKGGVVEGGIVYGDVDRGGFVNGASKRIIPKENNPKENNPKEINPKENNPACTQGRAVVLDPDERILEGDRFDVIELLAEENGIPYAIADDPKMAAKVLKVLADMPYQLSEYESDMLMTYALTVAIKALVEMVTTTGTCDYNNTQVTNKDVIDQLNILYRKDKQFLGVFMVECAERLIATVKEKKIHNPGRYMKSIIWGNITTFQLEWNSYVLRTSHGEYE